MKVLGMTQYKAAERFLFPTANKAIRSVTHNPVSAPAINHCIAANQNPRIIDVLDSLFSPVFKAIANIFG